MGPHIHFTDDSKINLTQFKMFLNKFEFVPKSSPDAKPCSATLTTSESETEMLALFSQNNFFNNPPDLTLMDNNLGKCDNGLKVTERLRKEREFKALVVLFSTDQELNDQKFRNENIGPKSVDDMVYKDLNITKVQSLLTKYLPNWTCTPKSLTNTASPSPKSVAPSPKNKRPLKSADGAKKKGRAPLVPSRSISVPADAKSTSPKNGLAIQIPPHTISSPADGLSDSSVSTDGFATSSPGTGVSESPTTNLLLRSFSSNSVGSRSLSVALTPSSVTLTPSSEGAQSPPADYFGRALSFSGTSSHLDHNIPVLKKSGHSVSFSFFSNVPELRRGSSAPSPYIEEGLQTVSSLESIEEQNETTKTITKSIK